MDDEETGSEDAGEGFDPSDAEGSILGGLGDAAGSLTDFQGHMNEGVADLGMGVFHSLEAAGDAFTSDRDGVEHRMNQSDDDWAAGGANFNEAAENIWGN